MNCPSNPTKLYKDCCKKEYKKLEKWTKSVEWVKLEIINATKDTVHFNAFFFIENGNLESIQENSNFCKENNYWVYLDAI